MDTQTESSDAADRRFAEFVASGSQDALAEALVSVAPELLRRARGLGADPELALDLMQATFLAAIESGARFDARRRLLPWLLGILENLYRYWQRRAARAIDPGRVAAPHEEDPAALLHRKHLREAIGQAVAALPSRYREVVALYVDGQMPPEQIARELRRTPSTVRTQLWRGLQLLRRRLPAGLAVSATALLAARAAAAELAEELPGQAGTEPGPGPWRAGRGVTRGRTGSLRAVGGLAVACAVLGAFWLLLGLEPAAAGTAGPARPDVAGGSIVASPPAAPPTAPSATVREPSGPVASATTVRVHLRWAADGSPAAGQSLRLSAGAARGTSLLQNWFAHVREAWSDAQGDVEFAAVPSGPARLLLDDAAVTHELAVAAGGVERTITLTPVARIEGQVVDAEGQPVADADVWLSSTYGSGSPGYMAARSGTDGRFAAVSLTPDWNLWATAAGHGCALEFAAGERAPVARPRLVLTGPCVRLSGVVTGADGRPIAGATLGVFATERTTVAAGSGFLPPQYRVADAAGRFVFEHLTPGTVMLVARDAEHRAEVQWVDCAGREQEVPVRLEHAGATVRGHVLAPADSCEFLVVSAAPARAAARSRFLGLVGSVAPVGADRSFELRHVHPGAVVVRVTDRRPGVRPLVAPARVTVADDEPLQLDLGAPAARAVIGHVLDEHGAPVAGVSVTALPADCDWEDLRAPGAEGISDGDGEFRLALGNDRPHVCQVGPGRDAHGFACVRSAPVVPCGAPLVLVLPASHRAGGRVRGVLSPAWPRAVDELHLVQLPSRQRQRVALSAVRAFDVAHVPPGRYLLQAPLAERKCFESASGFVLEAGATLDLGTLEPAEPGVLGLVVIRPDRAPVQLSRRILVETEDGSVPVASVAELDGAGRAELRLGAGDYVVRIAGKDTLTARRRVRVPAGARTELEIVLVPAVPCRFQLEPPADVVAARAVLEVLDQAGAPLLREVLSAGDQGSFVIELGLPAGAAQARALCTHGETAAAAIAVVSGPAPCQFTLRLR